MKAKPVRGSRQVSNSIACSPYLSWTALICLAHSSNASSQLMLTNWPEPRSPTRLSGVWIRVSP